MAKTSEYPLASPFSLARRPPPPPPPHPSHPPSSLSPTTTTTTTALHGDPPSPTTSTAPTTKFLLFSRYNETPQPTSLTTSPQNTQDANHHYYPPVKNENDDGLTPDKMDQLIERKRKRRESHNVVERKRRDNINARIDELGALLPAQDNNTLKLNRGVILQSSVDHIRNLHHQVAEQQRRIHELERLLGRNPPIDDHPSRSAEVSHRHYQQPEQLQQQREKNRKYLYYQQQQPISELDHNSSSDTTTEATTTATITTMQHTENQQQQQQQQQQLQQQD